MSFFLSAARISCWLRYPSILTFGRCRGFDRIYQGGFVLQTNRMYSNGVKRAKTAEEKREKERMQKRLIWVDCEMTGLEVDTCRLIEIAVVITEGDLSIVEEGPTIVIHQPDEIINNMNEWCIQHHGESGLTEAVRKSKISQEQAEYEVLSFVRKHTHPGMCPLAGNSIHCDKVFLDKYMPKFMDHCHYRIVDVSSIKEICRRWYPDVYAKSPIKRAEHRAIDDIRESIKELQYYQQAIFKNPAHVTIPFYGDKTSTK